MAQARTTDRRGWLKMLASRPRLLGAFLAGAVVGLAASKFDPHMPAATAGIIGWDVMCAVFMVTITAAMLDHGPDQIRARAEKEDEGRGLILTLVLIAAAASVGAIGAQLSLAKGEHGALRAAHIALARVSPACEIKVSRIAEWKMNEIIEFVQLGTIGTVFCF
jgi:uncharacterized membrane protein